MESERECVSDSEQSGLIPGLPDDISMSCIARIPRKYHPFLKLVSKEWRDLISGEEWHSYRAKHNLDEAWIYALCRDKSAQLVRLYVLDPDQLKMGWKRIRGNIPHSFLKRKGFGFEVLGNKVYLFGGCGWIEDATDEVYCYDASNNAWTQAGPLSIARCYFSSEALNGKIYAIGGLGKNSSNPQSWDIYDPQSDSWTSHEDPNEIPDIEDSVVYNGKIYIRCGSSSISSHVYAVVYEPSSGTWQHADADMISGWRGPAVVIDGVFYVLDQTSGVRLMKWENNSREWIVLRRLTSHFMRPPCRLVAIGKKIFVIGKGLNTVVLDIESASKEGVLMTSSVRKLTSDDEVISCKALAI